jgi:hypothetical protein
MLVTLHQNMLHTETRRLPNELLIIVVLRAPTYSRERDWYLKDNDW